MDCPPKIASRKKDHLREGARGRGRDLKEHGKTTRSRAPLGPHSQSLGFFTCNIRDQRR